MSEDLSSLQKRPIMQFSALFDVFSSLWLVGDMVLDCITTEGFYQANDHPFFWASLAALLLPIAIWSLVLWISCTCGTFMNMDDEDTCCACFICLPVIMVFYPLFVLPVAILWTVSPVLHFIQSIFVLFGVKPHGVPQGRTEEAKIQVTISIILD